MVSARNEVRLAYLLGLAVFNIMDKADVSPEVIKAKITNASGAKYSIHKEAPRQYVPIAPVGSSYTPVGRVDITQMRQGAPRDVPQPSVSIVFV